MGAVLAELRRHRFAYSVLLAFALAGPLVSSLSFPEAPPFSGLAGGILLGAYAALCAVPEKFLGD
jgi:hypothetical protein